MIFHPRWKSVLGWLRKGKFLSIFNSFPQLASFLPPLLGRLVTFGNLEISWQWYAESEAKGKEDWFRMHNLWRQPSHGILTILLSAVLVHFDALPQLEIIGVCFAYGFSKEVWEFLKDKKYNYPHWKAALMKSSSDVAAYVLFPLMYLFLRG